MRKIAIAVQGNPCTACCGVVMRRFQAVIESTCLVVVGVVVVIMSLSMGSYGNWSLSPGLFPFIMGCLLILLSAIMFFQEIRKLTPKTIENASSSSPMPARARKNTKTIVMVLLTIGYGVLMMFSGFIISTAAYVFVVMLLLNERRWWMLVLVPILTSLTIYVVFNIGLQVYLA